MKTKTKNDNEILTNRITKIFIKYANTKNANLINEIIIKMFILKFFSTYKKLEFSIDIEKIKSINDINNEFIKLCNSNFQITEAYEVLNIIDNNVDIIDELFNDIINEFAKYEFTYIEKDSNFNEIDENIITPKILNTLNEILLKYQDIEDVDYTRKTQKQKSTGSYYTPKQVIKFMIASSIIQIIKQQLKLNDKEAKEIKILDTLNIKEYYKSNVIKKYRNKIYKLLQNITFLEPAVGCGNYNIHSCFYLSRMMSILYIMEDIITRHNITSINDITDYQDAIQEITVLHYPYVLRAFHSVDINYISILITRCRTWFLLLQHPGTTQLPYLTQLIVADALCGLKQDENYIKEMFYSNRWKLREPQTKYCTTLF